MQGSNLTDAFNFISKLTLLRCWNAFLVNLSYRVSRLMGRPIVWGEPFSISVEPTTACNLGCPECPSGLKSFTRPTGKITMDLFKSTIDAQHRKLIYLSFYFQGEPFLHKGFLDMVHYASARGIYTATSTNAHFITDDIARKTVESGLDRLIISLDGTTQETYSQYRRGGQMQTVIDAAKRLVHWRKALGSSTPLLVFQFLVVRPNEHQVDEVRRLASALGMDGVWLKTAQVYDYANDPHQLIPQTERFSRYRIDEAGKTIPKNNMPNHCWKMWHSNVVTWDGQVVPCCFDKDAKHVMGKLGETDMQEIWKGKKYREFRQELMKSRKNIDICSNCSEGINVWRS